MSSSGERKYQKYCRVENLESVNLFSERAISIQTIKEACIIHYKEHGEKCDILVALSKRHITVRWPEEDSACSFSLFFLRRFQNDDWWWFIDTMMIQGIVLYL